MIELRFMQKPGVQQSCFWFASILLILTCFSGSAADWPGWRGSNRDDLCTETGLLKDWPKAGPPLVWKATGLGEGYSTVAISGDHLFTIGQRGPTSFVVALKLADGSHDWTVKLGQSGDPGGYAGPRGAPTADGDLLYALGQYGDLGCFETATGKQRWHKNLEKDFGGSAPNWGYAESPLVDGNQVVITPGGSKGAIVALDKTSGAELWRCKDFTDDAQYSSLVPAEIGGVRQYIQLTARSVVGVQASDGKLLWRASRHGDTAVIPTPIYHDGYVYVTSGYGAGDNLFQISGTSGKFTAKEVYSNKVMVNHHGGAILVGDYVYGYSDGKGWTCQDFKTGQARWQDKEKLRKGCLTYADGHLYLRQEDGPGTVVLLEASPAGYKEHGRFNPPFRSDKNSWTHPVISGRKLYVRDQDVLLCYDVTAK
jgi:outer membrane protein assembly factor BamB